MSKENKYELLVFDWDGTLMDSAAEIVAAMQTAIADIGLPKREDWQMRELIGLGMTEVLDRLFPELDSANVMQLLGAYRKRYSTPGGGAALFAGVAETITGLGNAGYVLAVATGKSRAGLDKVLAKTELEPHFRFSRCADEAASKPAPDMLLDILLRSATEPKRALMIGDTEYDMAMAVNAGVPAVGVACGVHDAVRLRAAGAMTVLEDVRALPGWLRTDNVRNDS